MDTLASMLRPSIMGPFACGDWAGIEARVLPWLAQGHPADGRDEVDADIALEQYLELFRQGADVYVETAEKFGGTRFEGKVACLSLGYMGGVRAFQAMARNYGLKISDDRAESIKRGWRATNPWAPIFWRRIEEAMWHAVQHPGSWQQAGRLYYGKVPDKGPLVCALPSGRMLYYPEIKLEEDKWGNPRLTAIKGSWKPKATENEWPRFDLYGGLTCENATQAVSADVLMDCMLRIERRMPGLIEGHTHDEILGREEVYDVLKEEMLRLPSWASRLPLDAEFWTGPRYKK
jgi:DNA polymerase